MNRITFTIKYWLYARSVGFNLNKHSIIEQLAFQTVAAIKLNPQSNYTLSHNSLTTFDSIIFTMFLLRSMGICNMNDRKKAEVFSNVYIKKVLDYFPDNIAISQKYDKDFFKNRVEYYDSIMEEAISSGNEAPIEELLNAFETIIIYDYSEKYIQITKDTPNLIGDIFENFKIRTDIMTYYNNYFPKVFIPILEKVYLYMD